jgi:hypothetical protein
MPEPELFLLFIRPLNRAHIPYIVGGSVAAIFYGEPRLTHDVDIVVVLTGKDVQRLPQIFPESNFYLPPIETIAEEVALGTRGQFNVIHTATGYKADFYPAGTTDELNAWGFRNNRKIQFEGEILALAPPEYVIVRKLEFFRDGRSEKHLRDIRSMLAISAEQIDTAQLSEWIRRLSLEAEWQRVGQE